MLDLIIAVGAFAVLAVIVLMYVEYDSVTTDKDLYFHKKYNTEGLAFYAEVLFAIVSVITVIIAGASLIVGSTIF